MSFFDDASLVMIPSGYKTSKVYSVKPTDGTGDLAFTRSNDTATRVASNGLIEKVRTNLLTYSQQLDNAAWTKGGVGTFTSAITTGFTDPTGGTNAQRWLATIGSVSDRAFVRQLATLTNATPYNLSFWIKSNTGSNQELYIQFQGAPVSTILATSTWTRYSYTQVTSSTSVNIGLDAKDLAIDVLVYGFQLETGDIATDYIATTTASVSVGPVANVPRLDYLNSSCPRLLLEPQRTNYATYSEQLTSWTTYGGGSLTQTANAAISPDGTTSADEFNITRPLSSDNMFKYIGTSTLPAGSMINSLWLKAKTSGDVGKKVCIWTFQTTSKGIYEATLTADWVRHTAPTWTATAATSEANFGLLSGYATSTLNVGFYAWGYQSEAGAYATSYIPTLGASVTRGADFSQKSSISGLFGATATTFVLDFVKKENAIGWTITGSNGTKLFSLCQFDNTNGNPRIVFDDDVDTSSTLAALSNGRHKIAVSYATNDTRIYIDGALVFADTACTYYQMDRIGVNATAWTGYTNNTNAFEINQFLMIPAATSNADLAALTA